MIYSSIYIKFNRKHLIMRSLVHIWERSSKEEFERIFKNGSMGDIGNSNYHSLYTENFVYYHILKVKEYQQYIEGNEILTEWGNGPGGMKFFKESLRSLLLGMIRDYKINEIFE